MKPLLVGELNPYGADPRMALYPLPEGASGDRLRGILGLTCGEYLLQFDRVNLCTGKWSMKQACEVVRRIREERSRESIILLGRRVATAFGVGDRNFFEVVGTLFLLPHPSGRCRVWNDGRNVLRAQAVVKMAVQWAERGGERR
jgi:hypothetical protein